MLIGSIILFERNLTTTVAFGSRNLHTVVFIKTDIKIYKDIWVSRRAAMIRLYLNAFGPQWQIYLAVTSRQNICSAMKNNLDIWVGRSDWHFFRPQYTMLLGPHWPSGRSGIRVTVKFASALLSHSCIQAGDIHATVAFKPQWWTGPKWTNQWTDWAEVN